jgi:hypothetical protein
MRWFAPLLVLSFGFVLSAEEAVRTWTDLKGRTMEARFIKFTGDKMVIKRADGRSFTVSSAIFSPEDRKYLSDLKSPFKADVPDTPVADDFPDYYTKPVEKLEPFLKGATIVVSVKGKVSIVDPPKAEVNASVQDFYTSRRDANMSEVLSPTSEIFVGENSEVVLLFSNGTLATLGSNTQMRIEKFLQKGFEQSDKKIAELQEEVSSSSLLIDLHMGEMIVDVKRLKKDSSFEITTPLGVAGIRGTEFSLLAGKDSTTLSVLKGLVDFSDAKKAVRQVATERSVRTTKLAETKEGVLNDADKVRIGDQTSLAIQKTANVTVSAVLHSFDEINPKWASLPPDGSLHIIMHVDGSGSILSVRKALGVMKDTILKERLLSYYRNDELLYQNRVSIVDGEGERTLKFFAQAAKKENVLALVFQDEAAPAYHVPSFNKKPTDNYLVDLKSLQKNLEESDGYYRGIMFQVDRGKTFAKSFVEFVQSAWRGEGYLSGQNLKPYYWTLNNEAIQNHRGIVFSDEYHAKSEGTPAYYMELIFNAARKIGLDFTEIAD